MDYFFVYRQLGHILEESSRQLKRVVPVKPIFISVDPDRDSLRQLRLYAKDFHPSIDYLTGTKDQVKEICTIDYVPCWFCFLIS